MTSDRQHGHTAQADALSCDAPGSPRALIDADLPLGAHLATPRRGYTHHGIYVGGGDVVHYAGLSRSLHRGPVQRVSLQEFAAGHPVWIKRTTRAKYSGRETAERALTRLGENRYRLTTNNCEHFCEWCVRGEGRSQQVDKLLAWPHAVVCAVLRGLGRILGVGVNDAQFT